MSNLATKIWMFAVILALGLGLYIGKTMYSSTQTVEVEKEVIKRDVVTRVVERVQKDGTKTIETIITDKTKEKKESSDTKVSATRLPDWAISVQAHSGTDLKPYYGLQVDRRILGPFSITVGLNERKEISAGVKYEF